MVEDELAQYLQSIEDEDGYRVDAILKQSELETTERVFRRTPDGNEHGPYIRKRIARDAGMGLVYQRIFEANRNGWHFVHLPFILDCHLTEQAVVVVMEHVNGQTLAEVVHERNPGLSLAAELFPQLCDAVSELHESFDPPIIHRDLKPSNIMMRNGIPVIIDFGIAREVHASAESDTTHLGTREYAPPEQFGYEQTTVRSDVYTLGLLLYYLLEGQTPTQTVLRQHFENPHIPLELQRVMVYATKFDPKERYESVAELKTAFQMALAACAPITATMNTTQAAAVQQSQPIPPEINPTPLVSETPTNARPQTGRAIGATSKQGRARNIAVVIFFALLIVTSFSFVIDPSRSSRQYPPLYHAFLFGVFEPILFAAVAYACLDKNGLQVRHPTVNWLRGSGTRNLLIAVIVVLSILTGIVGYATGA
ncbi:MAG: protein kinase [Coriobacteriia bacterium]|nr:protein kinase [Coriobacteriia bacterium]